MFRMKHSDFFTKEDTALKLCKSLTFRMYLYILLRLMTDLNLSVTNLLCYVFLAPQTSLT